MSSSSSSPSSTSSPQAAACDASHSAAGHDPAPCHGTHDTSVAAAAQPSCVIKRDGADCPDCSQSDGAQHAPAAAAAVVNGDEEQLHDRTYMPLRRLSLDIPCSDLRTVQDLACRMQPALKIQVALDAVVITSLQHGGRVVEDVNLTCVTASGSAGAVVPPPRCVTAIVDSPSSILDAMTRLQPVAEHVVLTLSANLTWQHSPEWPQGGVDITRNVTIAGDPSWPGFTEIDFQLQLNLFRLHASGHLELRDLMLSNMPLDTGPYLPTSLLPAMFWFCNYDLKRGPSSREQVAAVDSTVVVPGDVFEYLSYWISLATSPLPHMSNKARWMSHSTFGDMEIGYANEAAVMFVVRTTFGSAWRNVVWTPTPAPGGAQPLLSMSGLTDLIADDPYVPLVQFKNIMTAEQLRAALLDPQYDYYLLAHNVSLLEALAPWTAAAPLPPSPQYLESPAELPVDESYDEQLGHLADLQVEGADGSSSSSSSGSSVGAGEAAIGDVCRSVVPLVVQRNLTLLGAPGALTILDLGGCPDLLVVAPGVRLVLRHLTLVNAGPASVLPTVETVHGDDSSPTIAAKHHHAPAPHAAGGVSGGGHATIGDGGAGGAGLEDSDGGGNDTFTEWLQLANFTSMLWAFHSSRSQPCIVLQEVTLVLPPPELAALRDLAANGSSPLVRLSPQTVRYLVERLQMSEVTSSNPDIMHLASVAPLNQYTGISVAWTSVSPWDASPSAAASGTAAVAATLALGDYEPPRSLFWLLVAGAVAAVAGVFGVMLLWYRRQQARFLARTMELLQEKALAEEKQKKLREDVNMAEARMALMAQEHDKLLSEQVVLQGELQRVMADYKPSTVLDTGTPAEKILEMLNQMMKGSVPKFRDMLFVQQAIQASQDIYQPVVDISQQIMMETSLEGDVGMALMATLGKSSFTRRMTSRQISVNDVDDQALADLAASLEPTVTTPAAATSRLGHMLTTLRETEEAEDTDASDSPKASCSAPRLASSVSLDSSFTRSRSGVPATSAYATSSEDVPAATSTSGTSQQDTAGALAVADGSSSSRGGGAPRRNGATADASKLLSQRRSLDATVDGRLTGVVVQSIWPDEWAVGTAAAVGSAAAANGDGDKANGRRAGAKHGDAVGSGGVAQRAGRLPMTTISFQAELLLSTVTRWQFDVFALSDATCGRPLSTLAFYLLQSEGIIQDFGLNAVLLARYLRRVEEGYLERPYHNKAHAAAVLQTMHVLLKQGGLRPGYADPLTTFACYFAATVHDVGHLGLTNDFLINTSNTLALRYNDRAPQENHHLASAFALLHDAEYNFLGKMSKADCGRFRQVVIELVLGTEMKQHFTITAQFRTVHQLSSGTPRASGASSPAARHPQGSQGLDFDGGCVCGGSNGGPPIVPIDESEQLLSLQMALKCADLGHMCSDLAIHKRWVSGLEEEFFQQGDAEQARGLTISPLFDRTKEGVSKSQIGFFDIVVIPLFTLFSRRFTRSKPMLTLCMRNYNYWKNLANAPAAGELANGDATPSTKA